LVKKGERDDSLLKEARQNFQGELESLKKEVASQISPVKERVKKIDILKRQGELPVEDKKEVIGYFGPIKEIDKILSKTKELLAQKNLQVALENLENISFVSSTDSIANVSTTEIKEEENKNEQLKNNRISRIKRGGQFLELKILLIISGHFLFISG